LEGSVEDIIREYENVEQSKKNKSIQIKQLGLQVTNIYLNKSTGVIKPYGPLEIEIEIFSQEEIKGLALNLSITNSDYEGFIFSTSTRPHNDFDIVLRPGINKVICYIKNVYICSGIYNLGLGISIPMVQTIFFDRNVLNFEVLESSIEGSILPSVSAYGLVYLEHTWVTKYED